MILNGRLAGVEFVPWDYVVPTQVGKFNIAGKTGKTKGLWIHIVWIEVSVIRRDSTHFKKKKLDER